MQRGIIIMENNLPEISVLLPIYNTNPVHLRECIESILNQTFQNFELIILNDASTENLDDVVNSFDDCRIKYYKNETNSGITKTRNKLLSLASGKYIAICDHDDISLPERFEKEYNFLEQNPEYSIVSSWVEAFYSEKNKIKIWKRKPFPKYFDFLKNCELLHQACMWRKKDFEKYNLKYEDGYLGAQDYAMFSKAIRYLKFANLQEPLLRYRKYENNTSNFRQKICVEADKIQNEMIDFLSSDEKEKILIYKKFTIQKASFIENIFSVKNVQNKKVIRIFGFVIIFKLFKTNQ